MTRGRPKKESPAVALIHFKVTETEIQLLEERANQVKAATGCEVSRSELIRTAIRLAYGKGDVT